MSDPEPAVPLPWPAAAVRATMIGVIRVYQSSLARLMPNVCRFQPTCSHYFVAALRKKGVLRGSYLGIRRILRCNPFGGSGWDPVE